LDRLKDDTGAEPTNSKTSGGGDTAATHTEHATELIETSAAPTPELAWSDAEEQGTEAISDKPSRVLWLGPVMALLAAVIAVASVLLFYIHRAPAPNAPVPTPRVTAVAPEKSSQPPPHLSAQSAAETIRGAIPQITDLIPLTEDNDDNHLISRPNGYAAATVIVDSRVDGCSTADPGVDCGATVEQWPDQAAAQRRADYIQKVQAAAPILGSEWDTVNGNLLLRVTGKLKPSDAEAYQAAFAQKGRA
jgi:serine/threonine protein kinase, bacterial